MSDAAALDRLSFGALHAAEIAAIAAAKLIGRGDKIAADQAAVDAMRQGLNAMDMKGRIVIGEGERDEAPMLYIGEEVGTGNGPEIDIALDPLEGTDLCAKGMPGSLAVLSIAPRGGPRRRHGGGLPAGVIDLDMSPSDNVKSIAKAKGCSPEEVVAIVLERERHQAIVDDLRSVDTPIMFIPDGDVEPGAKLAGKQAKQQAKRVRPPFCGAGHGGAA